VTGDAHVEMNRRSSLDGNRLGNNAHRLLRAAKLGRLARPVEPLQEQVLDVGGHIGFAPGNESIAADRHGGRAGERRADDIEVAGAHVSEVPE